MAQIWSFLWLFLVERGLESHIVAARAWCEDMGVAFLSEVLDNLDVLGKALVLSEEDLTKLYMTEEGDEGCRDVNDNLQHRLERGPEENARILDFISKFRSDHARSIKSMPSLEPRSIGLRLGYLPSVAEHEALVFQDLSPTTVY